VIQETERGCGSKVDESIFSLGNIYFVSQLAAIVAWAVVFVPHGSRPDLNAGTFQLRRVSVRQCQWPVLSGAQNTSYGTLHILVLT
jgi:hypothetical protein